MSIETSVLTKKADIIIKELSNISNIKYGEYWNTSIQSTQKANLLTSIIRSVWYTNESRELTFNYLETLINETFKLINDFQNQNLKNNKELIDELKISLLNSRTGIINLSGVYHKDTRVKYVIDVFINNINNKLLKDKKE